MQLGLTAISRALHIEMPFVSLIGRTPQSDQFCCVG